VVSTEPVGSNAMDDIGLLLIGNWVRC
jgi:hypothetical protein